MQFSLFCIFLDSLYCADHEKYFLDFSSFTGVINARAKLRNELFILLRFYYVIIHIRRGLRKVCAVRTRDFNDVGGSGISAVAALKA